MLALKARQHLRAYVGKKRLIDYRGLREVSASEVEYLALIALVEDQLVLILLLGSYFVSYLFYMR